MRGTISASQSPALDLCPFKDLAASIAVQPKKTIVLIIINDIRADAEEMQTEGRSGTAIWAMKAWHSLTSICGILWDGLIKVIQKIWATCRMFH